MALLAHQASPANASPPSMVDGPIGLQPADEVRRTLRRRLRWLSPFFIGVCLFYLARNLLGSPDPVPWPLGLLVQGGLVLLLAIAMAPLYGQRQTLGRLRVLECLVVGLFALFLAWRQCCTLYEAFALRAAEPTYANVIMRMALGTTAVRWVLLVVSYGVLIPNSVRRCAVILAGLTLMPLLITAGTGLMDPALTRAFLRLAAALVLAALLSLYACYRLNGVHNAALDGQTIGPYRLLQLLCQGGMGAVFLAEHLLLRRRCAVKLIRADLARDHRLRARFEREVHALAAFNHPRIVSILDAGRTEEGTCYYAMEYVAGTSLSSLVTRQGPLPPDLVLRILRQLAETLESVHGKGFLHLDLTPSNILLNGEERNEIKLIDFGLAQDLAPDLPPSSAYEASFASPAYASPEQCAGAGPVDQRSDLYSLGALGYFLLTGEPPFVREGALATMLAHAFDGVTPPDILRPVVPDDLQEVILRCLAKAPEERYPNARALREALEDCSLSSSEEAHDWPVSDPPDAPEGGLVFTPIPRVELTEVEPVA